MKTRGIKAEDRSEYMYQVERMTFLPYDEPVTRVVKEIDLPDLRKARIKATKAYNLQLDWIKDKYVPITPTEHDSSKGLGYNVFLKMVDKKKPEKVLYLEGSVLPEEVHQFRKQRDIEAAIFHGLGAEYPCNNHPSVFEDFRGYEWSYKVVINYSRFPPIEAKFCSQDREHILSDHLITGYKAKEYYLGLLNNIKKDEQLESIEFFMEGTSEEYRTWKVKILEGNSEEMDRIEDLAFFFRDLDSKYHPELAKEEKGLTRLLRLETAAINQN